MVDGRPVGTGVEMTAGSRARVAILTGRALWPVDDGGRQRVWQLIGSLRRLGCPVLVLSITTDGVQPASTRLVEAGCETAAWKMNHGARLLWAAIAAVCRGRPLQESFFTGGRLRSAIAARAALFAPELVIVDMLRPLPAVSALGCPVLADAGDLLSLRYRNERQRNHAEKILPIGRLPWFLRSIARAGLPVLASFEAGAMYRRESGAWRTVAGLSLIAADEVRLLASRWPRAASGRVHHLPLAGPDAVARSRAAEPQPVLGLLGNLHLHGNVAGLAWLLDVHGSALTRAGLNLRVVGTPTDEAGRLIELARARGIRVELVGFVPDLDAEMATWLAGLALALQGTGTSTKVFSCLARGVPVLGTAAGLRSFPEHPALIRCTEDLPDHAQRLLHMPKEEYVRLAAAACALYNSSFAPALVDCRLSEIIRDCQSAELRGRCPS
jgi:hypothetical protein